MRILITGANGFVGSYLISCLSQIGTATEIVGLVHGPHSLEDSTGIRYIPGDISDAQALRTLIRSEQPEHVYHLAGAASGAGQDRDAIFSVNVDGTRRLLDAVAESAPDARVLFTSTGYVYGDCGPDRRAREADPPNAIGFYAESKQVAEADALASGAIVTRSFNHTGPGQTTAFAVPAFAAQIAAIEKSEQSPELQVGNLTARRDFLDVRDVVRAYVLLMTQGARGQAYNVCSGQSLTMQSLLDQLLALSPVPITVTPDPARMRPSDIAVSVGDPQRLHALAGWKPEIPLEQTLRDTLDWWRGQQVISR